MERLFNLTREQIQKQSGSAPAKCDYNEPIRQGETLEPCLRGSKKIVDDNKQKEMMRRIYRGK